MNVNQLNDSHRTDKEEEGCGDIAHVVKDFGVDKVAEVAGMTVLGCFFNYEGECVGSEDKEYPHDHTQEKGSSRFVDFNGMFKRYEKIAYDEHHYESCIHKIIGFRGF